MSLVKANGAGDQDTGFYNGVATQSLRFNDDDSAFLSRTPSSASNRKTFTWSGWVKRGNISLSASQIFFGARTSGSGSYSLLFFEGTNDYLYFLDNNATLRTSSRYRDCSAWYHIVLAADTTQATDSNRVKLYVNGTQLTDFVTATYPNQDTDLNINSTATHLIGKQENIQYFDGYLAEVNFVDGSQLDPTSFGETKNGVWIPKAYSGSYGTNGFRLQFNQTGTGTASSSTIGADTSGQTNHFTSSGLASTDANLPDSPENNFATMNTLDKVDLVLAEGNLKTTGAGNSFGTIRSTFAMPSGSWYAEFLCHAGIGNGNNHVGISTQSEALSGISGSNFLGSSATSYSYSDNDNVYNNGSITNSTGTTYAAGDIIGVTFTGSEIKWYKNNSLIATVSSITGNDYCFTTTSYSTSMGMFANFGQDSSFAGAKTAQGNTDGNGIGDFYYSPPSGFLALCSSNLSEPTIGPNSASRGIDHFGILTYTSDGNAVNIVSGGNDNNGTAVGGEINFSPDWVWIKRRNASNNHQLFDTNRGTNVLQSNETDDESDYSSYFAFLSSSNGFRLPATSANMNANGGTYVAWNWKANGGTTSSNSNGSIASTVQANTTAGFSIVTYTSNGGDHTVGHGLGVAPKMIWLKDRDDVGSWYVYNENNGANKYQKLNDSIAATTQTSVWQNTAPTTTVFSVGGSVLGLANNTKCIAYCFAEVEGYSKIGSYTGNGSTDGTFIYLGFRPAFIIYKRTDSTGNWLIDDDVTQTFNPDSNYLVADTADLEGDTTTNTAGHVFDMLSNGFKMRNTNSARNASGGTFIYMAFADIPFKFANAR